MTKVSRLTVWVVAEVTPSMTRRASRYISRRHSKPFKSLSIIRLSQPSVQLAKVAGAHVRMNVPVSAWPLGEGASDYLAEQPGKQL